MMFYQLCAGNFTCLMSAFSVSLCFPFAYKWLDVLPWCDIHQFMVGRGLNIKMQPIITFVLLLVFSVEDF